MRYERFFGAILMISTVGCVQDAPEQPVHKIAAGPPGALCVEVDDDEAEVVALKSPAYGGQCDGGEEANYFSVEKDSPISFALYGATGVEYCVEVSRDYGYITISHDNGVVTRDDDLFTWCIIPTTKDPEYMMVRSFTASSGFELTVP